MPIKRPKQLKSGEQYNHLFPPATMIDYTVKRGATVQDTVKLIPKVVQLKRHQIQAFVNQELKGLDTYQVCEKLWHFIDDHIAYKPDTKNYEQIRTVRRTWHDRFKGVDCDCYTTFISCALTCLNIQHILRITKYKEDRFQHIYPIVPLPNGQYITIDNVVDTFNYEEPFSEKQDTPMDLQILDGLSSTSNTKRPYYGIDADTFNELSDELGDMEQFGKLGNFVKKAVNKIQSKPLVKLDSSKIKAKLKPIIKPSIKLDASKIKAKVKNTIHAINKVNPATVLLRNGVLASMKLNVMNVAGQLRWSYLSEADAKARGVDFERFKKLVTIREKLEHLFHGAGGQAKNLKEAILKGKGNTGNGVPLNGYYNQGYDLSGINEQTNIQNLLGQNIYYSENIEGMEGLGNLGEVTTAAALTAASGFMATFKALINSIGSIFPNVLKAPIKKPKTEAETGANIPQEVVKTPIDENGMVNEPTDTTSSQPTDNTGADNEPIVTQTAPNNDIPNAMDNANAMVKNTNAQAPTNTPKKDEDSFWNKNKSWIKPTAWGLGGLAFLVLAYKLLNNKPNQTKNKALNGLKTKKKIKKPVALM